MTPFHAEWLLLLDRLLPLPSMVVGGLIISQSERPWTSGLLILLYALFNMGVTQLALRTDDLVRPTGMARFCASAGPLFLLTWLSGPESSAWFLGVITTFAAVFAQSGWHQLGYVISFTAVTLVGTRLGGMSWDELLPVAVQMAVVGWLSVGLSRALYDNWNRARASAQSLAQQNETLEAALSARQRFLATMSHEVRTPLNGVLGMAEVLQSTVLEPEQRGMVRTIQTSGQGLLQVLNDVLDTAKLDAGKLRLSNSAYAPATLIGAVVALMQASTHGREVRLIAELDPKMPAALHGDPSRIRQVLLNLVGNALKFTPEGEVRVRARWEDAVLFVEIQDTGIGISEAAQERIFQPFSQAEGTETSGGTGLGLAICLQLTELMQGTLTLQSQLGQGSCFRLCLPAPLGTLSEAPEAPAISPTTGRILLVDDNEVNLQVAERMLILCGCTPTLARDGQEALHKATAEPFDLILMDCQMPRMDGLEATRKLRERGLDLPILALTASVTQEAQKACLDAGMDQVLAKPLSLPVLSQALGEHLGRVAKEKAC